MPLHGSESAISCSEIVERLPSCSFMCSCCICQAMAAFVRHDALRASLQRHLEEGLKCLCKARLQLHGRTPLTFPPCLETWSFNIEVAENGEVLWMEYR